MARMGRKARAHWQTPGTTGYGENKSLNLYKKRRRKELVAAMTPAERLLWAGLKRGEAGVPFVTQYPLEWEGGLAFLDFYCHRCLLVVEADGPYHDAAPIVTKDAERTRQIAQQHGMAVIRFTNERILHDTDAVLEEIKAACSARM